MLAEGAALASGEALDGDPGRGGCGRPGSGPGRDGVAQHPDDHEDDECRGKDDDEAERAVEDPRGVVARALCRGSVGHAQPARTSAWTTTSPASSKVSVISTDSPTTTCSMSGIMNMM